ncbi:hypothetical protein AMTR_s00147p00084510 [Amborella trichopoda]|uniref:Uncharacterized protein n=1 Tax=Amborella trichopoda TaxID=13333 RepID=W1P8X8_AMBTC|nr:hypothetical protein AMTR_s00147p00084510 [Amborella trichopoda]
MVTSQRKCSWITLSIQGVHITNNMFVLPLGGREVVLGAQWHQTLGPIIWDFSKMIMQFEEDRDAHVLKDAGCGPKLLTSHKMEMLLHQERVGIMTQYCAKNTHQRSSSRAPDLQQILAIFADVFDNPIELPLSQTHD